MAISYVGKSAFASGQAGLTVDAVAGVQADDLILLFVETANESVSTPANFDYVNPSELSVQTGTAGAAGGVRLYCFYRWATGADATTSVGDSGNHTTAIKIAYRGVSTSTPFDATMVTGIKSAASTTATWPGITTVTADAWIVLASALDLDAASTATTGTPTNANLSGLAERHDQTVSTATGGGIVVIDGQKATAGATGTTTATVTSTVQVYATIALRPQSVADIAGDLVVQETGGDTFVGAGSVEATEITGSLLAQESGSDALAGSSAVAVSGTMAAGEAGSDTFAGLAAAVVAGAMAVSEAGADAFTAAAEVAVAGAIAAQEQADGFAAAGEVAIVGSAALAEPSADAFVGGGSTLGMPVEGNLAAQEAGTDLFAGIGSVDVAGSLETQDGADGFAGASTVEVTGSAVLVEVGGDGFFGAVFAVVSGALAAHELGADTLSGAASLGIVASGLVFESGSDLGSAVIAVEVLGSAAMTEVGSDTFVNAPPEPPPTDRYNAFTGGGPDTQISLGRMRAMHRRLLSAKRRSAEGERAMLGLL